MKRILFEMKWYIILFFIKFRCTTPSISGLVYQVGSDCSKDVNHHLSPTTCLVIYVYLLNRFKIVLWESKERKQIYNIIYPEFWSVFKWFFFFFFFFSIVVLNFSHIYQLDRSSIYIRFFCQFFPGSYIFTWNYQLYSYFFFKKIK
jgi:hypothetical protein